MTEDESLQYQFYKSLQGLMSVYGSKGLNPPKLASSMTLACLQLIESTYAGESSTWEEVARVGLEKTIEFINLQGDVHCKNPECCNHHKENHDG